MTKNLFNLEVDHPLFSEMDLITLTNLLESSWDLDVDSSPYTSKASLLASSETFHSDFLNFLNLENQMMELHIESSDQNS